MTTDSWDVLKEKVIEAVKVTGSATWQELRGKVMNDQKRLGLLVKELLGEGRLIEPSQMTYELGEGKPVEGPKVDYAAERGKTEFCPGCGAAMLSYMRIGDRCLRCNLDPEEEADGDNES